MEKELVTTQHILILVFAKRDGLEYLARLQSVQVKIVPKMVTASPRRLLQVAAVTMDGLAKTASHHYQKQIFWMLNLQAR